MRKVFAGLASAAAVAAITYVALAHWSLHPSCDLTWLDSRLSPAGRYVASVFQKDCGATTDYVTGVVILPADQAFAEQRANLVLIVKGAVPVGLEWETDDEINIKPPPFAQVFRQVDNWNQIRISID